MTKLPACKLGKKTKCWDLKEEPVFQVRDPHLYARVFAPLVLRQQHKEFEECGCIRCKISRSEISLFPFWEDPRCPEPAVTWCPRHALCDVHAARGCGTGRLPS